MLFFNISSTGSFFSNFCPISDLAYIYGDDFVFLGHQTITGYTSLVLFILISGFSMAKL